MKKQFLNLGKALNRAEQKQIFGGADTGMTDPTGCSQLEGLYCDCPAESHGNAEGCGCLDDSWCVMGNCHRGYNNSGMFGHCQA
ncbi:hypothetical protein MKD41_00205 [Lutibacter sp. A64]|uniref:hypothetical protein n=1 Tax=Lutibacter sp. A64 TaxID=2918526 RepID=UPI001F060D53|nr:hypothetical protein [Lutibacter sp. A64]UMB53920.1 hypothetical protein MKD41_00205 [Lutibacter sp. A64]